MAASIFKILHLHWPSRPILVFEGTYLKQLTDVDSHDGVLQEEDLEPGLIEQDEDYELNVLAQVHDELSDEWPSSYQRTPPPTLNDDVVTHKLS